MENNDFIVTAKLKNDKHVVLSRPNFKNMNISYRYMLDRELQSLKLDMSVTGIMLSSPIYRTFEDGDVVLYTIIDATPIILSRFKEYI
ncbi:hypothetical protein [Viridibacillus arvi]|uniref:hypothetical protein n=1 Tax=Viridibacillus arvi TaxID=263475 RepID=UPI0034CFE92E